MRTINVNGKIYKGDNLRINNNKVYIDGKIAGENDATEDKLWFRQMSASLFNIPKNMLMRIEISGVVQLIAENSSINILGNVIATDKNAIKNCDITCNTLTAESDLECGDINATTITANNITSGDINGNDIVINAKTMECADVNCNDMTASDLHVNGDLSCDDVNTQTITVSGDMNCGNVHGNVDASEINAGSIYRN